MLNISFGCVMEVHGGVWWRPGPGGPPAEGPGGGRGEGGRGGGGGPQNSFPYK